MQSPDSQIIVKRFFDALDKLKDDKKIRGIQTFTTKYDINKRNLYHLRNDMSRDIMQTAWLTYLVRDFGVSANWLLTGEGSFYELPESYKKVKPCNNPAIDNNTVYKEI